MGQVIKNFRILLVEDNSGDALLFKRALRRASPNICVVTCGTAEGAKTELTRSTLPFDLIVTDVNLPGHSGIELIRYIREQSDGADVPIVVMSSSGRESDISAAYSERAREYIVKPYSLDEYDLIAKRLTMR